jgi:hypothetical protein
LADQGGINVGVDVLKNTSVLFSSNVTALGQVVPFNGNLVLAAGDTLTFSVLQGFGNQNTGLDVSISQVSATPLPAALPLFATGLGALSLLRWSRKRKADAAKQKGRDQARLAGLAVAA